MKSKKLQFAVAFSVLQAWTVTSGIASAADEGKRARDLNVDDIKSVLLDAALTLDGDVDTYPRYATLDGLVFPECLDRFNIEAVTKVKDGNACIGFKVHDAGTGAAGELDAVSCSISALEKFKKDPTAAAPVLLSSLVKEHKASHVNSFKVDEEFGGSIAIIAQDELKRKGECINFDQAIVHVSKSRHEAELAAADEKDRKDRLTKFKKDLVTCNKNEAVLQDTRDSLDGLIADGILDENDETQKKMIDEAIEITMLAEKDIKKKEIAKALAKASTPEQLVALREKLATEAAADSLADPDLGETPLFTTDEWTNQFLNIAAKQKDSNEDLGGSYETLSMIVDKSNPLGLGGLTKASRERVENERLSTIADYSTQTGMTYGTKSAMFQSVYSRTYNSLVKDWTKASTQYQRYCGQMMNQKNVARCNEASNTLGNKQYHLQNLAQLPQTIEQQRFQMQKQLADMRASMNGTTNNNNGSILNPNNSISGLTNGLQNNFNPRGLMDPASLIYQQNSSTALNPLQNAPGQFSLYNLNS